MSFKRLRAGRRDLAARGAAHPAQIGRRIAAQPRVDLEVDRFRASPRLPQRLQRRRADRLGELLDHRQRRRRFVRCRRARRRAPAGSRCRASARPPTRAGSYSRIRESGELQQRLMRRELRDERQPVARAKLARLGERRGVERNVRRESVEPRQRRMPQRGDERAVPSERTKIDRDRRPRAPDRAAHGHYRGEDRRQHFPTLGPANRAFAASSNASEDIAVLFVLTTVMR